MKIVSVTISPTKESAHDAMESVRDLVDEAIDLRPYKQPIEDFSYERNTALVVGEEAGADWVMLLDTDERIHEDPEADGLMEVDGFDGMLDMSDGIAVPLRIALERTPHDMLHVWAADHPYAKPRLFRLPAKGHYTGPTHECWVSDPGSTTGTLEGITFSELPKTEEQYRAKAERDREILETYTQEHPDDPRWWYYLGDAYSGLGQRIESDRAFIRCWNLNGWDEESAWSAYRIATAFVGDGNYESALTWCCNGMTRHPGMAELPWLAGYCCFKLGRFQHAIWWEEMAARLNEMGAADHRINFRHEPALWEGPLDVLSHAYAAMGDEEGSKSLRFYCENMMKARLGKSRAT